MRHLACALALAVSLGSVASAQSRVEKNIVYANHSGLALLMDVHRPATPNGVGLVLIPGSAWHLPAERQDAPLIKDGGSALFASLPHLTKAGYTLFVISHRAAPRFRYPDALVDAQRAVRFVRSRAADYGIRADAIGAVGYSSGAHLALLLGVLEGKGLAEDVDPVNRLSARVQCVVVSAAPTDLAQYESSNVVSFMGAPARLAGVAYRDASPITHIARSSAPVLLIHGDADELIPFRQAELMMQAANKAGAEVKLIRVPGGTHTFAQSTSEHAEWPDIFGETVRWLDGHLKAGK